MTEQLSMQNLEPETKTIEQVEKEAHEKSAPKTSKTRQGKRKFERKMKNDVTFLHDLFELDVRECTHDLGTGPKNRVWVKREHKHKYHTFNSRGKMQKYSSETNGHFHEVTVQRDKLGNITDIKCGPALKWVNRMTAKGIKTFPEPVQWKGIGDQGQPILIVDKHSHDIDYRHSEELSKHQRAANTNANAGSIMAAQSRFEGGQITVKDEETGATATMTEGA